MLTCRLVWGAGLLLFAGLAGAADVAFESSQTVARVGETRVIPFRVDAAAEEDRTWRATAEPAGVLEVVRTPTVVEGHRTGFVRVRGVKEGKAKLRFGGAAIDVTVKPRREHQREKPIVFSPTHGAAAWGAIGVGVRLWELGGDVSPVRLQAKTQDGREAVITPLSDRKLEDGPIRHVGFEADLSGMTGPVRIVAAVERDGRTIESEPVWVSVVEPGDAALATGEAEAMRDQMPPERYRDRREPDKVRPLRIGEQEAASGGKFVSNHGANPPLCIPATVAEPGWHQLMLRVSADQGGVDLPTVGLRMNNNNRCSTASPVAAGPWHRTPVGRPIWIGEGEHLLLPYFENDFARGKKNDRNLRIDRYELLRLDAPVAMSNEADAGERLRIALDPRLDGRVIGGEIEIRGAVTWPHERLDPPRVTLLANGEAVDQSDDAQPRFLIGRGQLREGANTLQLEARLADGTAARSTAVRVRLTPHGDSAGAPTPLRREFTPLSRGWSADARASLNTKKRKAGRPEAAWHSNREATLTLPEDMEGAFTIALRARGDQYDGPPVVKLTVEAENAPEPLLTADQDIKSRKPQTYRVGPVTLPEGPKRLTLAFTNDLFDPAKKKDRNFYFESITFERVRPKDETAPAVQIVYPAADGAEVHGVDAIIAEMGDDRRLAWAELVIDGEPTGVRARLNGDGRVLLPLVMRGWTPGEHAATVRVQDAAGNAAESAPRVVKVRSQPFDQPGRYESAVRLLDRFAYGPDPAQLARVLVEGERAYLESSLTTLDDPADANAWAYTLTTLPGESNGYALRRRTLDQLMTTPNPVRGRLRMFVDNHFSTWHRKTGAARKYHEHLALARPGAGAFGDLLDASAYSPAMLVYLDQHRSYRKRINENYAREIMELHTLGVHGGYTQDDVTQLAHLLTGWTITEQARPHGGGQHLTSDFRYDPRLGDNQPRVVFGLRLDEPEDFVERYDRIRLVLEMLASHPSTARFISTKLAEHYLAPPAPPEVVEALVDVFHQTHGDTRAMLLKLHEIGEHRRDLPRRMAHPMEYAVRLARVSGEAHGGRTIGFLDRSGFGVFDRDTPDGYPEADPAYADSNAMLQRWKLAQEMEHSLMRMLPETMRKPPADEAEAEAWRQRVVDLLAARMTGRVLDERSNRAVLDVMAQSDRKGNDLIMAAAVLIAQMPEANLR